MTTVEMFGLLALILVSFIVLAFVRFGNPESEATNAHSDW